MTPHERGYWIQSLFRIGVALTVSLPATAIATALVHWAVFRHEIGMKDTLNLTVMMMTISFIPFMLAIALHPRVARVLQERRLPLRRSSVLAGLLVGVAAGAVTSMLMLRGLVVFCAIGAFFGLMQGLVVGYWKRGTLLSSSVAPSSGLRESLRT